MEQIINKQKEYFLTHETKNINFRLNQLKKLENSILSHYEELKEAFKTDYNKCEFDMVSNELGIVMKELHYMQKNLKRLSKPKKVHTSIINFPSKGYIYSEPYGVTLIVAPWNYPLQLSLVPVIDSLACGNTIVLKLSVNTPNISQVINDILKIFDEKYVYVTKPEDRDQIFNQNYDFCFYTGSTSVGKELLKKQANFLTPCVLELGGKSPCIVDEDADMSFTSKRLIWGKFLNAGQTCVAPDYLLVHKKVKSELIKNMLTEIKKNYYSTGTLNSCFTGIVNEKQVNKLLDNIKGETILCGGNANGKIFEPTLLDNITFDSKIMQEEIFGPILPIIEFENIDSVLKKLNTLEKPLAFYFFGNKNSEKALNKVSFGGGCVNETIMHLTEDNLPFGGVGFSGMGCYHGKKSFETFSHFKSILKKGKLELNTKYPPYTKNKMNMAKWIFKIKQK